MAICLNIMDVSLSSEETNFIKAILLITVAIPKGLQTLLSNSNQLTTEQSYDFKTLSSRLQNDSDVLIHEGLDVIEDLRKKVFYHVTRQSMPYHKLEDVTQKIIDVFKRLQIPLDEVHDIYNKSAFNEDEFLSAHEKLSLEKRRFCYLGPSCTHKTIQRTDEIYSVLNQLNKLNEGKINGNSTIFIDGGHGSGKRELAKQVADSLSSSYRNDNTDTETRAVMIVDGQSEQTLLNSYIKFAKELLCNLTHIQTAVTSPGLPIKQRLRILKHIIADKLKQYNHWVVVINNVNHYKSMSDYWPAAGSNEWGSGYVIITLPSIKQVNSTIIKQCGHISLSSGMIPSQAIQLMCEVSEVTTNYDDCLKIAEILEFYPLALACAAVFVKNHQNVGSVGSPWKEFQDLFERNSKRVCKTFPEEIYSAPCATVINMLHSHSLSSNNRTSYLYFTMSTCKEFSIEWNMLEYCQRNEFEGFLQDMSPLLSINQHLELDKVTLRHNLVTETELEIDEERLKTVCHALLFTSKKLLQQKTSSFILDNFVYELCCNVGCIAAVIGSLSENLMIKFTKLFLNYTNSQKETIQILKNIAEQLHLMNFPGTSKWFLSIAASIIKQEIISHNDEHYANMFYNLGILSCATGNAGDANDFLNKSLEMFSQMDDGCKEKVQQVFLALGDVAVSSEDFVNAKKFFEKAKQTTPDIYKSMNTAVSLYKLGNVLAMQGFFQEAKEHYEQTLQFSGSMDFANLAKVLTCLGAMCVCASDFVLAKDYLQKAIDLELRLYGKYNPCRMSSIKNAANSHEALEEHEAAMLLLKEYISISQSVVCELNPSVAQVFSQLGSLQTLQEDWPSAIVNYTSALEIHENILRCNLNPAIANSCCDLGHAYANCNQLDKARSFHEKALGIRGLLYQADHPDISKSYSRLGKVYSRLDDNQTALSLLERAVEIQKKTFGQQHPETLDSLFHLGHTFARLGKLQIARNIYRTVAERQVQNREAESALAKTSENLGQIELSLGHVEHAKIQFQRAIKIQRKVAGSNHAGVARPLVKLALLHEHCKEMRKAKTLLEKALVIYRKNSSKLGRSQVILVEAHLRRVLSKLPQKNCVLM